MKDLIAPWINCRETSKVSETGLLIDGSDCYEQISTARDTVFPKGINWLSNQLSRSIE